ncbi:MAG TPA: hypothetical protein VFP31_03790 [Gaiellaceae bacterium]|nr:hypothetical protein [Gaiellaceae bacterium]
MRHARALRRSAVLVGAVIAAVTLAAAASGGQVFRDTIHEEDEVVLANFCDVPGLTVNNAFVLDLRVHIVPHGRDRLDYFLQHGQRTDVYTNVANGKSVRAVATVTEKDLRVTDNGDGTLTILILATGNAVLYGANGKAIARNPGQIRFEVLVDHNGTPTDPSDDEFIADLGVVKGSTGRSDDFCAAAVSALG